MAKINHWPESGLPFTLLHAKLSRICENKMQVPLTPSHAKDVHPILTENLMLSMESAYELGLEAGRIIGKNEAHNQCSRCEDKAVTSRGMCRRCNVEDSF